MSVSAIFVAAVVRDLGTPKSLYHSLHRRGPKELAAFVHNIYEKITLIKPQYSSLPREYDQLLSFFKLASHTQNFKSRQRTYILKSFNRNQRSEIRALNKLDIVSFA